MTNEELVAKAITVAESLATSGKLNPAQANKFIDFVVDESVMQDNVRVVKFTNEELKIDKIGIGNRVMQPAVEYQSPQDRLGVTTSQLGLKPQEVITAFDIGDSFKEVNIEGESVEEHIIKMFATGWRNDTELLAMNADTVGPAALESDLRVNGSSTKYIKDSLLAMFDGWYRKGDSSHLVNALNTSIGLSVFGAALRAMPQKFQRNLKELRFFMSTQLAQLYIEKVATRMTPKGDQAAEGEVQTPFGIPIVPVPLVDLAPKVVQTIDMTTTNPQSLRYAPYSGEIVTLTDLDKTPVTPYIKNTDYSVDYVNGTITRMGGSIPAGLVKVTYLAGPQIILTHWQNFILAIGRDIRIEKARNIHKRADEFVVTGKLDVQVEETDAMVKVYNVGTGL